MLFELVGDLGFGLLRWVKARPKNRPQLEDIQARRTCTACGYSLDALLHFAQPDQQDPAGNITCPECGARLALSRRASDGEIDVTHVCDQ